MTPRGLSGIQPTSDSFHVGNHLGALQNWVAMQETHECVYFIADMHAITVEQDPKTLRNRTLLSYAQLLALGIDPNRSTLIVQSHVPELRNFIQCIPIETRGHAAFRVIGLGH